MNTPAATSPLWRSGFQFYPSDTLTSIFTLAPMAGEERGPNVTSGFYGLIPNNKTMPLLITKQLQELQKRNYFISAEIKPYRQQMQGWGGIHIISTTHSSEFLQPVPEHAIRVFVQVQHRELLRIYTCWLTGFVPN